MHCVDLGESFQTHIYLHNLASIQPRTSPVKFVGSRDVVGAPGQRPICELPFRARLLDDAVDKDVVPTKVQEFMAVYLTGVHSCLFALAIF